MAANKEKFLSAFGNVLSTLTPSQLDKLTESLTVVAQDHSREITADDMSWDEVDDSRDPEPEPQRQLNRSQRRRAAKVASKVKKHQNKRVLNGFICFRCE
jgi:hypothetical protein